VSGSIAVEGCLGKYGGDDSAELRHLLLLKVSRYFDSIRRVEAEEEEKGEKGGDMHKTLRDRMRSAWRTGVLEVSLSMGSELLEPMDVFGERGGGTRGLTKEKQLLESIR
jgi:hypothetical protein